MRSVSASSIPASAALAIRPAVIARVMTRAWVALISPAANAPAVVGSCSSRLPVDTTAVASAEVSRQLPRNQAFMDTAPSRR